LSSHAKKQIDFISDSVQLFIDRAVLVKRDLALTLENLKLVNELCASLEGIPLAIELAAGWADSFTLAELLAAVSQQLELTARMDDVPERQRSIRASLDWSYGMLNDEQAAVLRAVAIFKGGFFFEAIESMSRRPDLRKLLTGFCDKGWLFTREVMGKTRYFIRDVATHQYAFEKLKLSEEFSERSLAHAEYFADLTNYEGERLSGRDEVEAIRALTLEIENIYVALDAALAQEDIRLIMPFVKFLKRYISAVCKWQEGVEHYRKMVKASERFTSNTLKVHSQLGLSAFLRLLGNYAEAEITANDALSYSVEAGDSTLKALSLSSLGAVASGQGRFAEAEELHKESLRILHETDDKERTAAASLYLGVSVYNQGRLKAAKGYFKESLRMSTELGDRSGIASSLHSLGRVARYRGHYSEAEKLDQESLQIQIELGNRCGIANCLYNLGRSAHGQKRYAEAEKLFNDSLQITRELGERWGIASSLLMLGDIACIQGSYAEAEKLYSESMIICREAGFRPMLATSLTSLGIVNARQGRGLNARECLLDSIRIAKEIALRVDYTGLVLAGYLLATSRSLNDAAIVLNRTADIAQAEGKNLNPIEQNMIDEGMGIILTELSKEELTALKEQGEKMTLDELANYTLKALEGTKERGKG
jgi:tetratricopeptide (TPR) repeat protein